VIDNADKRLGDTGLELKKAEDELVLYDRRISERSQKYVSLRNPQPVTIEKAKAFCGDDTAVLEYVLWDAKSINYDPVSGDDTPPAINSYCLVLTKDGVTAVRLDHDFDYAGTVNALRGKIIPPTDAWGRYSKPNPESIFEAERNALYNALVKPVLPHLQGKKDVVVVPDDNLAFLPFDILRENAGGKVFGETFNVALSPSVSVSVLARENGLAPTEPIIAFGGAWYDQNPYENNPRNLENETRLLALEKRMGKYRGSEKPGAGAQGTERAVDYFAGGWKYLSGSVAEVQGLEKISTVKPVIIQGKDVSERRVKELSDEGTLLKYPIVHFACHGFFNDSLNPKAGLVFSEVSGLIGDESAEDGYLSVEEVSLLRLNAQMVMLSACETGLGKLNRGEGMTGLARAFMTAGAKSVGISLWVIDDVAVVEFMWNVYGKVIHEKKTFRTAYYEAKQEFRKTNKWSHPFYWAAFTMYE
jgi:CHAT domain-containing protein